jgi:single-strand DNA-binding protein
MAASNMNVVAITGNLTRDPEVRSTPGGITVCKFRVAVNSRRKDGQTGQWVDKPNYFDVSVWGAQGENCMQYLVKGRPVAIEGRLDWREWEAKDGTGKRQSVEIVANSVQFLGSRSDAGASDSEDSEESSASSEFEVTPQARTKAEELGVDVAAVTPKDGKKVRASDVEAHAAA